MNHRDYKIVLFASSSIVISTLNTLLETQQLAGVILTDRVDTDTMQLEQQLNQANIPYVRYQPSNPEVVLDHVALWQGNLGLIFTFTHKLPVSLLNAFPEGIYNLHASSLPKYRGAMPLYWQIRNQESEGCLSIVKVEAEFDCGDIMTQQTFSIQPTDTLNSLGFVVAEHTPDFVKTFLTKLKEGGLAGVPQKDTSLTDPLKAPMPSQKDLTIDWPSMTSQEIAAMARAGNPLFNGALMVWRHSMIGLLQATPVEHPSYGVPPGTVLHIGEPEGVIVATKSGALRLDILTITEGVFSGVAFSERFGLDAGVQLD